MFNNSNGFVMPVAPTGYGNNGGGLFGGDDSWLALIVILAIFGWGGNGFGGGFAGFGGGRSCGCEPCATKADLTAQGIVQKLDGITYGITDSTYALNNSIMSGFHGVDNAICTLGYQNQQGFNSLAHQISDCCCQTQRSIDGVRYDMATQACDTRHAIQDSTRQILDFLTTDKIASLQAENQALKFKASQSEQNAFITANQQAQTAELIRRLGADCPVNAYVVQPPTTVTFPTNCCGQFSGFGYNNGGCGCGCA